MCVSTAPNRKSGAPYTKVGRRKNQPYEFVLFNDMLLYAERRLEPTGWKYRLHKQMPLVTIFRVTDLPDVGVDGLPLGQGAAAGEQKSAADHETETKHDEKETKGHEREEHHEQVDPSLRNRLQVDSHQKSFVVYASSPAEKV